MQPEQTPDLAQNLQQQAASIDLMQVHQAAGMLLIGLVNPMVPLPVRQLILEKIRQVSEIVGPAIDSQAE